MTAALRGAPMGEKDPVGGAPGAVDLYVRDYTGFFEHHLHPVVRLDPIVENEHPAPFEPLDHTSRNALYISSAEFADTAAENIIRR